MLRRRARLHCQCAQFRRTLTSTSTSPSPLAHNGISQPESSYDNYRRELKKPLETPREFLERIRPALGISERDYKAWHKVSIVDLLKLGAQKHLEKERYQVLSLLKTAYPEHTWMRNSFGGSPYKFSKHQIAKIRASLLTTGQTLKIIPNNFDKWYSVPFDTLVESVGLYPLVQLSFSRHKLFSLAFPEHTWHPWLFKSVRKSKMEPSLENQRKFAKHLEEYLGISRPEDWYGVSRRDLAPIDLQGLFKNQSDYIKFLYAVYPNVNWDPEKMAWSTQGWSQLESVLELLFPGLVVSSKEFFGHMAVPQTLLKLDRILVIPTLKLIFEYQGPIAYASEILERKPTLNRVDSDLLVELATQAQGFTPISVPFWWDRQKNSLLAEIFLLQKDLFEPPGPLSNHIEIASTSAPIPREVSLPGLRINEGYLRRWKIDPRFGEFDGKTIIEDDLEEIVPTKEILEE